MDCGKFTKKINIERPTSNIECKKMKKQSLKSEPLNDIFEESWELIKFFVVSIETAEKKLRLGVVKYSVLDVYFSFDVGRSMFDVHLSKRINAYGDLPDFTATKRR